MPLKIFFAQKGSSFGMRRFLSAYSKTGPERFLALPLATSQVARLFVVVRLSTTSETAVVARLLGAEFEPAPESTRVVRRIEFTGVGYLEDYSFAWPMPGGELLPIKVFPGQSGEGHIHVEYPFAYTGVVNDALSATRRDLEARRFGVTLVETLKSQHPAFSKAMWAGSSHEVEGEFTPVLTGHNDRSEVSQVQIPATAVSDAATITSSCFYGGLERVLCLNEAARLPQDIALALRHPVAACDIGVAFSELLEGSLPLPEPECLPVQESDENTGLSVREQPVPERGVDYELVTGPTVTLPQLDPVDTIIVGGGTSGGIAAVASGTNGMRTILVDMNPGLGGTGTYGGIHAYWFGNRGGFSGQVTAMTDDMHVRTGHQTQRGDVPQWNIECKIHALLEGVIAAGVMPLLNTMFIGTLVAGNQVRGAIVATRFGLLCTCGRNHNRLHWGR